MKSKIFLILFLSFTAMTLLSSCRSIVAEVESNKKGIIFHRFEGGLNKDKIYGEGLHFIAPWDRMITYDISVQQYEEHLSALSKDGLLYEYHLVGKYHVQPDRIGYLQERIGANYLDVVVKPELRSAIRGLVGEYTSEEIPAIEPQKWDRELLRIARPLIAEKYILVDTIIVKEIIYPKSKRK